MKGATGKMKNTMKKITFCILSLSLTVFGSFVTPKTLAQNTQQMANGHGTLLVPNKQGETVRRQFSFNARRRPDGTVNGQAIIHNPAFITESGKYMANIEISCLNIVGN